LRGEGWGEGLARQRSVAAAPHAALRADLSPQPGRGEFAQNHRAGALLALLAWRGDGFTLIEILAAFAIGSVIMLSSAALMWNVIFFFDRGTRGVNAADHLVVALDRLAADFAAARYAQRITTAGSVAAAFVGRAARGEVPALVTFVSGSAVAVAPAQEDVVVLKIEQADGVTRLVRRRSPWMGPRTQLETIAATDAVVLIEGQLDIRFSFGKLTPEGTSWQDNWLDEFTLPRYVRLILRRSDTGAELLPGAEFVVRSNAPPSCAGDAKNPQCLVAATAQPTAANQRGALNASH
jgi:prepilin-type N-terminal cleavage/methylation domain-containing protein